MTKDLIKSDYLRKRFGYPNQINLPIEYSKRVGRGIYPKKIGMINFVNLLEVELLKRNVKIYYNSIIEKFVIKNNFINKLYVKNLKKNQSFDLTLDSLRWGANLLPLAKLVGVEIQNNFDMANQTYLMNLVLNAKPRINKVYYLMDYNLSHSTFRITNYSTYCPESCSDGKYRLTVEVWPNGKKVDYKSVIDELIDSNIITDDSSITFHSFEKLSHGFPLPTINNNSILNQIRNDISNKNIENLISFGQFSKHDTFFLPQILNNAYNLFQSFKSRIKIN